MLGIFFPWFAIGKKKKKKRLYSGRFYKAFLEHLWPGCSDGAWDRWFKEDVGVCCPWIVSQLCFSGYVYLSPPLSALTECLRGYNSD